VFGSKRFGSVGRPSARDSGRKVNAIISQVVRSTRFGRAQQKKSGSRGTTPLLPPIASTPLTREAVGPNR
jgi:hypothetical protein